jgi:hypothetical protein
MKRGSADAGVAHGRAGHFNFVKIEVSRPSVPLPKAEIHQTNIIRPQTLLFRPKTAFELTEASERDTSFFPIHSKCPAEVSRRYPATVEAGKWLWSTTTMAACG